MAEPRNNLRDRIFDFYCSVFESALPRSEEHGEEDMYLSAVAELKSALYPELANNSGLQKLPNVEASVGGFETQTPRKNSSRKNKK